MYLRLFKFLVFAVVLGGVAVTGYAFFGDLTPAQTAVQTPVTVKVD